MNIIRAYTNINETFKRVEDNLKPFLEHGDALILPDACPVKEGVLPVGTVLRTENKLFPDGHSADVCCSMHLTWFDAGKTRQPINVMMDKLVQSTHFGSGERIKHIAHDVLDEMPKNEYLNGLEAYASSGMATQGNGNHFASILKLSNEDKYALVTHHGSRGLGANVYLRGKMACKNNYLSGIDIKEYMVAMQYIEKWTLANHQSIAKMFLKSIGSKSLGTRFSPHNFVWERDGYIYHGKGATPVVNNQNSIIPMNMLDGILLTSGHNDKFWGFAPHGAGRNESRTQFLKKYTGDDGKILKTKVRQALKIPVDVRWYLGEADIAESHLAYKSSKEIIEEINNFKLTNIDSTLKTLGTVMAGRELKRGHVEFESHKKARAREHRADRRTAKMRNFEE